MRELKAKGAVLKATEQPIDTSSAAGKAFLDMLGVFAEFETNLRRERQMEGIAAARPAGFTNWLSRRQHAIDRSPPDLETLGDLGLNGAGNRIPRV